ALASENRFALAKNVPGEPDARLVIDGPGNAVTARGTGIHSQRQAVVSIATSRNNGTDQAGIRASKDIELSSDWILGAPAGRGTSSRRREGHGTGALVERYSLRWVEALRIKV